MGLYFYLIIIMLPLLICGLFWMRRFSSPQVFGEAIRCIATQDKIMALTFDDGPNPDATLDILGILAENNVKATFFVLGRNVENSPEIAKSIISNGHELGNHTWGHTSLTFKSSGTIRRQIDKTDNILREIGYTGVIHFRAPFGHKFFLLPYLLMKAGRPHILWNIKLNDWDNPPLEDMLRTLDKKLVPGSIILLHDGYTDKRASRAATVELVRIIISEYTAKGYKFVTISELLAHQKKSAEM